MVGAEGIESTIQRTFNIIQVTAGTVRHWKALENKLTDRKGTAAKGCIGTKRTSGNQLWGYTHGGENATPPRERRRTPPARWKGRAGRAKRGESASGSAGIIVGERPALNSWGPSTAGTKAVMSHYTLKLRSLASTLSIVMQSPL